MIKMKVWDVTPAEVREAFGGQDIPVREFMDFWNSLTWNERMAFRREVLG